MFLILCFMLFTAPKEPNQIPLLVINADNDQNEAEPEQESHDLAEPIDDIIRIVDAVLDP